MTQKKKYFTTRKWGFGSNIVNFIKSAAYCFDNQKQLVLQDRYNTISNKFLLFSPIVLPSHVIRNTKENVIPVDNLKSLVKFIISREFSLRDKLKYSFFYCFNIESEQFIKNFNLDKEVNLVFNQKINQYRESVINKIWIYTDSTIKVFKEFDVKYDWIYYNPDLCIQIRGGDKIKETIEQGRSPVLLKEYFDLTLTELKTLSKPNPQIYVMTDTYSYYINIKDQILAHYPDACIRTLAKKNHEGYQQEEFNGLDLEKKMEAYYFFLYELEFLRKTSICIGSFNSNIFYLAFLISYNTTNKYISVDSTIEDNFL